MSAPPMVRRQIRRAMELVLREIVGADVKSPGALEMQPAALPLIFVRTPDDSKASTTSAQVAFSTTVTLEIIARLTAPTPEEAQDQVEELGANIEQVVYGAPDVMGHLVKQVASARTRIQILTEGELPLAELWLQANLETFETFEPFLAPERLAALREMVIHLDLLNPTDPGLIATDRPFTAGNLAGQDLTVLGAATGTEYPSPAFPDGVVPAPRTSGRDGRDEAVLHIPLGGP